MGLLPRKAREGGAPEGVPPELAGVLGQGPTVEGLRVVVLDLGDGNEAVGNAERELLKLAKAGFQMVGPPVAVGTQLVYTLTRMEWNPA